MPCRIWKIAWKNARAYGDGMTGAILSIAMLAGFALLWGAWRIYKRGGPRQQMWMMIAVALIAFANVAIWTIPDKNGNTLAAAKR